MVTCCIRYVSVLMYDMYQPPDIDECLAQPSPCANGGQCINLDGSFMCGCRTGYGGTTCDESELTVIIGHVALAALAGAAILKSLQQHLGPETEVAPPPHCSTKSPTPYYL